MTNLKPLQHMRREEEIDDLETAVRLAILRGDKDYAKVLLKRAYDLLRRVENDLP